MVIFNVLTLESCYSNIQMTPVLVIFSVLTQDPCSGNIQCVDKGSLFW